MAEKTKASKMDVEDKSFGPVVSKGASKAPKAGKKLPRVTIEGADNGGIIVTTDKDAGMTPGGKYTPPERHVFSDYASADSFIDSQFGYKD